MTMTSVFAEITKTAPQDDGSIFVYGKATGSDLDLDGQRCDPVWLQRAMPEFMKIGNIREQHDAKRAVGKAIEHEPKDDGHWIKARIVDPVAVAKTQAGIFTGFSIGIKSPTIEKSDIAPNGSISGGSICEISLVDRPALPTATLMVCKAAKPGMSLKASDFDAQRMLVRVEELTEKTTDVDHLDAPAPGQKCADCGADGHLKCADVPDMQVTLADRLSPEQAAVLAGKVDLEDHSPSKVFAEVGKVGKVDLEDHSPSKVFAEVGKGISEGLSPAGSGAAVYTEDFDRDAAKALIAKTVADADAGLGQDESGDISGALQAISIIAELIQSEAKDLGTTPAQGCDIDLLMQAVHALRIFNCREAKEQAGIDPGPGPIMLAADADVTKDSKEPYGDVSYADPGFQSDKKKRYPLDSKAHAKSAWDFINQASNADKYSADQVKSIKSRIMAACKKFGVEIDADSKKAVDVDDTITNVDEAQKAADESLEKAVDAAEEVAIVKTDSPETTKAVEVTEPDEKALAKAVTTALEKIFSTDELEKADNPIRKTLGDIVSAANESTVKSVNALTERLETVEQMATPGGPALRRTEIESKTAQKSDLLRQAEHWRIKSESVFDRELQKGYAAKAAELLTKANTLEV